MLLLFLFLGVGYLSIRGVKTLRWYCERFRDFPAGTMVLVPFVF